MTTTVSRPFPGDPGATRSEAALASRGIRFQRYLAQMRVLRLTAAWPEPTELQAEWIAAARHVLAGLEEHEALLLGRGQ